MSEPAPGARSAADVRDAAPQFLLKADLSSLSHSWIWGCVNLLDAGTPGARSRRMNSTSISTEKQSGEVARRVVVYVV